MIATNSNTGLLYVVDSHQGGQAAALQMTQFVWGKLADIYETQASTGTKRLVCHDFLVGGDIQTDGVDFVVDEQLATQRLTVRILHAAGTPAFTNAMARLEATLQPFIPHALGPNELPPFTAMPRNAAIGVRFDDLLDDGGDPTDPNYPGTVTANNVQLLAGASPLLPFPVRVKPDANHGDVVNGRFHSTRVLIDPTISEFEAQSVGLPINSLGLPEASTVSVANAGVRIPTRPHVPSGQFNVLRNLSGATLSVSGNGPVDVNSPTLDVVRGFRSGGKTSVTGDANNGFVADLVQPKLLLEASCRLKRVIQAPFYGPQEYWAQITFPALPFSPTFLVGSVVTTPTHVAEIVHVGAQRIRIRLLQGGASSFGPANGTYTAPWSPSTGGVAEWAVRFSPPAAALPASDVASSSSIQISFSEAMDAASLAPFEDFRVEYLNNAPASSSLYKSVVGGIAPSLDLRRFTFQPSLPLRLVRPGGQADTYRVLLGGANDLSGNPLANVPPATTFALANGPTMDSGGISLAFDALDEDGDGFREIRGQMNHDLVQGLVKPRAVTRFTSVADASVPVVGAMIPFTGPVQTPLADKGSKMMGVWRYHDVGFSLRDQSTQNVDVEGLWWTPFSGNTVVDNFDDFQLSLAHSKFLPDEEISSGLLPNWVSSGLVVNFESNLMDKVGEPLKIVHDKSRGYTINPSDVALSSTNIAVAPWPLNRGIPASEFEYWTWRDTGKTQVAAPSGAGADTQRLRQITQTGQPHLYDTGKVPTIGLPLLMEFRTYPDDNASGLNGFKVALAINSSARPYFRVHSTGGINVNNPAQIKIVQPDFEPNATGAFPQNGNPAPPSDNVFYYGQADFLVRISRAHTIWFDSFATGTLFSEPVTEPSAALLPAGTQIVLAYRGATSIAFFNPPPTQPLPYVNAVNYDDYGDGWSNFQLVVLGLPTAPSTSFTPSFFNVPANTSDRSWKSSISAINGARFIQARVTFISNAASGATPELSALGFAYRR